MGIKLQPTSEPLAERIISAKVEPLAEFLPHIQVREFTSARCGASRMHQLL